MKHLFSLITALMLMVGTTYAQHHGTNGIIRTVANVTDSTITVNTPDGKSQMVLLTPETKYARTDTIIIKVGEQVVIQTTKKDDQLTAVMVKVGVSGAHHHTSLNNYGILRKHPAVA